MKGSVIGADLIVESKSGKCPRYYCKACFANDMTVKQAIEHVRSYKHHVTYLRLMYPKTLKDAKIAFDRCEFRRYIKELAMAVQQLDGRGTVCVAQRKT